MKKSQFEAEFIANNLDHASRIEMELVALMAVTLGLKKQVSSGMYNKKQMITAIRNEYLENLSHEESMKIISQAKKNLQNLDHGIIIDNGLYITDIKRGQKKNIIYTIRITPDDKSSCSKAEAQAHSSMVIESLKQFSTVRIIKDSLNEDLDNFKEIPRNGNNKNKYLLVFRFQGKAKFLIKQLVNAIYKNFGISSTRVIPHITLAGPFTTNDEKRLIKDFIRLCSETPLMNFEINGFGTFEERKVLFLVVQPCRKLKEFRMQFAESIRPYCTLSSYDHEHFFTFHSTLAMKLPEEKFSQIKEYIISKQNLHLKHIIARATLLKEGLILTEYDFLLRRTLTRREAKDKQIYFQTITQLKDHLPKSISPDSSSHPAPSRSTSSGNVRL